MKNTLPENERALWMLKTKGPQSLIDIAGELKVTTEGARAHLLRLAGEGLVEVRSEPKGRGRPQQIWSLTDAGNSRFPDTHAELTVKLIQKIRDTLGEPALDIVIEANGKDALQYYRSALDPLPGIKDKLSKLASLRSKEGYMAEYKEEGRNFLFIENHCPICTAAKMCQGFCKSELSIFRTILGDSVSVERTDHIVAGARRCAYQVKMKDQA